MKKRCTLKSNGDFQRLYRRGKSIASPYLVVYCRPNRLGVNRMGYTVSTKLGRAVVRNRVRRRFREIVRLNSAALTQGWDIILVARGRAVGAPFDKLTRAYLDCCGKLGLIREAAL